MKDKQEIEREEKLVSDYASKKVNTLKASRLAFIQEWNSMRKKNDEFVRKVRHEQKMKDTLDKIAGSRALSRTSAVMSPKTKEMDKDKENDHENKDDKKGGNNNEEVKVNKKNDLSAIRQENNLGLKDN